MTFWVTVACATDMTLVHRTECSWFHHLLTQYAQFGYDQGVFGGVIVTDDFLDTLNIRNNVNMKSTVTVRD